MKKIALIVSVTAGLAGVGMAHLYEKRLETEVSGGPKVQVLVAAKDLPVGATLKKSLIGVREIPQAYLEERHVRARDLKKVVDTRVNGGLKANETVLWSDLAEFSDSTRVLSGLVQQGMRAVALNGRDVDFGGLLRPGDRVDVLLTIGGQDKDGATRTLVQNLLVLAVGTNIARFGETKGRIRSAGMVTLSATVEGVQLLAQARQRGKLSLSLRNSDDITVVEGLPETTNQSLSEEKEGTTTAKTTVRSARGRIERVR